MTHKETIRSLITPHAENESLVFQKFLLFLLEDPKYGSINQTKDQKSTKAIQGVIDLYKEWIDTGKKPERGLWLKAKELAWAAAYAAYAATATATATATAASADASADAAVYAAASAAATAATAAGIPRSEVEKAQLDKLESLIKTNGIDEDELFSEADYEIMEET